MAMNTRLSRWNIILFSSILHVVTCMILEKSMCDGNDKGNMSCNSDNTELNVIGSVVSTPNKSTTFNFTTTSRSLHSINYNISVVPWYSSTSFTSLTAPCELFSGYNTSVPANGYSVNLYKINRNNTGKDITVSNLTISSVQYSNAGCYVAVDGSSDVMCKNEAWSLIVLGGTIECTHNYTKPISTGDSVWINCSVTYSGSYEPKVDLMVESNKDNQTYNATYNKTYNDSYSAGRSIKVDDALVVQNDVIITTEPHMNGSVVKAVTYFLEASHQTPPPPTYLNSTDLFEIVFSSESDNDTDYLRTSTVTTTSTSYLKTKAIIIGAVVGGAAGLILILIIIIICLIVFRKKRKDKLPQDSGNRKGSQNAEADEENDTENIDMQPYSEFKFPDKDVKSNGITNETVIHSTEASESELNDNANAQNKVNNTMHEYAEVNKNRTAALLPTTNDPNPYAEVEINKLPTDTTESAISESVPNQTAVNVVGPVDGTVYAALASKPSSSVSDGTVIPDGKPRPAQKPTDLKPAESSYAEIYHPQLKK